MKILLALFVAFVSARGCKETCDKTLRECYVYCERGDYGRECDNYCDEYNSLCMEGCGYRDDEKLLETDRVHVSQFLRKRTNFKA